jgi:hypothetical protein
MNDDRYAQYGAATGMVFVVLTVIGFLIVTPTPPDLNAPAQEWSSYFLAHHRAVRAGLVIVSVGLFFFIWFLGSLSSLLRIATGNPRLPSIVFAGGILVAATFMIGIAAEAVAAYRPQGVDSVLTRGLNDIFVLVGVAAVPAAVAFFGAIAVVILRTGAFPAWLGWLTAATAVLQPLTFGTLFTKTGAFAGDGPLGLFIPVLSSVVTIFALSALFTAWARQATQEGNPTLTDRITGAVTGAAAGAAAGARGKPPTDTTRR